MPILPRTKNTNAALIVVGFALVAIVATFSLSLKTNLDVDENVFVASGALVRDGQLPYRDFHYNHMPLLTFVYAGLFRLSDHLILVARSFSALCGAGAVLAIFIASWRWFAAFEKPHVAALGIGLLFLANPLFTYTSGLAWNHDAALLCCLCGFLVLLFGVEKSTAILWMILAGFLLGLAVTIRLTYAASGLAFLIYIIAYPRLTLARRCVLLGMVGVGFIIAVAPSAWVWAQSPQNAYFGNFLYPALNTAYYRDHNISSRRPFTVGARVLYLVTNCFTLPGNGVVTLGFIAVIAGRLRWQFARSEREYWQLFCILVMVLCLTAAAFAAAPMQRQYMYAVTPFMILGIARGVSLIGDLPQRIKLQRVLRIGLAIAVVCAIPAYNGLLLIPFVKKWQPMMIHHSGEQIAALTDRKLLTLEPAYALEAKRKIYESLATGRFETRAARYLSAAQRTQYKMIDLPELYRIATTDDCAILITGTDQEGESLLKKAASERGLRSSEIEGIGTLYH